ncbi:unannotated protein [freshwater metagenome]|uniref:Unannotated protein n=1 Tax=freshwater metagenome TaxID=449393 RepID=A0A6J7GGS0_9ZZZZ
MAALRKSAEVIGTQTHIFLGLWRRDGSEVGLMQGQTPRHSRESFGAVAYPARVQREPVMWPALGFDRVDGSSLFQAQGSEWSRSR